MDRLTDYSIQQRIKAILEDYDYNKRRLTHPDECPCNSSGPCHDEELNCFFCYCPWYESEKSEGGCGIGNPLEKGKFLDRRGHPTSDKIWDCSDCNFPHKREVVEKVLRRLFTGELKL